MRQLILDTETTGFEPGEGHRIIEFAALEMIERRLTGKSLHLYFNPERDIPLAATNVHGITFEQVAKAPTFREKVDEIIEFIHGAELIIHNAKFDLKFMDHHFAELERQSTLSYALNSLDTLMLARKKFPGAKNSLDALCDRFKINRSSRTYHGALIDCELLAYVYLELTKEQISLLADVTAPQTNPAKKKPNQLKSSLSQPPATCGNEVQVIVSAAELAEHTAYLQTLDKVSNGNSLWYNQVKDSSV